MAFYQAINRSSAPKPADVTSASTPVRPAKCTTLSPVVLALNTYESVPSVQIAVWVEVVISASKIPSTSATDKPAELVPAKVTIPALEIVIVNSAEE